MSVVIPVWRDEDVLSRTLNALAAGDGFEVVIACVLGEESRYAPERDRHVGVRWVSAPRGRGVQMNAGAAVAGGRWLLFLHADSRLPHGWLDVIQDADADERAVGGAFALRLDSRDWRARVIEAGVRLRVALAGLPYGDQALFVRRDAFERLGGYRDLPLMEDVDLVRRLKRLGGMVYAGAAVTTSARRWEQDGWRRRSTRNLTLVSRFLLGGSPARLAQRYFHRPAAAVVMMGRAPWSGGKTRLTTIAPHRHVELRRALFLDTLDVVRSTSGAAHVLACEPADALLPMHDVVGASVDVIAQRGGDLGERLAHVFEDVFRLGHESVVVIGSDLPDLPPALLLDALAALRSGRNRVVLGPASDGGYYLIGMNRPHPEAFRRIPWSTGGVLARTIELLDAMGVEVVLLPQWADVDTRADLTRLLTSADGSGAARTRAWVLENPG